MQRTGFQELNHMLSVVYCSNIFWWLVFSSGPGVLPELYPAGPSSPLRGTEVVSLRVSALACSAYVTLCLSEFPAALQHAEALLTAHPKTPAMYK